MNRVNIGSANDQLTIQHKACTEAYRQVSDISRTLVGN